MSSRGRGRGGRGGRGGKRGGNNSTSIEGTHQRGMEPVTQDRHAPADETPVPAAAVTEPEAEPQPSEDERTESNNAGPAKQHPHIYSEDVVCSKKNPKKVGLVSEVPWETESEDEDDPFFDQLSECEDGDDNEELGEEEEEGGDMHEDEGEGEEDDEDEGGDDDDDDEIDRLMDNDGTKVEVMWLAKNPLHEPAYNLEDPDDIQVIDRAFLPGDIVARADDPFGQSGTVVDVDMCMDIKPAPGGAVLQGVPSARVRPIHPFSYGVYVVKGGWLGTVYKCSVNIHIRFQDGSVCVVENAPRIDKETGEVVDADNDIYTEDDLIPYYPTMEVFVEELGKDIIRNSTWLSGAYRRNFESGTITKVEPSEVIVEWLATTFMARDRMDPPDTTCKPEELKVLDFYGYANRQIFDFVLLDPEPATQQAPQGAGSQSKPPQGGQGRGSGGQRKPKSKYLAKQQKLRDKNSQQKEAIKAPQTKCGIIIRTYTRVTVVWQDSTREQNVPSVSLIPLNHLLDADFWPDDFVQEVVETQFDNQDEDRDDITGKTNNLRKVLERLHINSETGNSGQDVSTSSEQSGTTNEFADEVPAQTTQSRLGIIKKVDSAGRTCIVRWLNDSEGDDKGKDKVEEINEEEEGEEVSFYQIMIHPDFKYRLGDVLLRLPKESNGEATNEGQWVGELIGLKNGKLLVQWSDSTRSWVAPGDVYALDTSEDLQIHDDALSDDEDGEDGEEQEEGISSATAAALTATGPNSGLMQSILSTENNWWMDSIGGSDSITSSATAPMESSTAPASNHQQSSEVSAQAGESENEESENSDSEDDADRAQPSTVEIGDQNAQFAFLPSDSEIEKIVIQRHRYRGEKQQPANQREWTGAVVKDWGLLKKSLPPGVYVRGFGSRMDLLKFLIIGPAGTPYVHSPFVFDVYLPPTYPNNPPLVHYCSVLNERFHPNLYETGKVCLSLLGTWEGKGVETWSPESSNLLQVVVSIQGLILGTSEPYYLEAGYEKLRGTAEGERKSKLYNESAFLLSIRAMSATLRNPPPPFQHIIQQYFAESAGSILSICRPYLLNPVPLGPADFKVDVTEEAKPPLTHTPSKGFCHALTNVFPRLAQELLANQQHQPKPQ